MKLNGIAARSMISPVKLTDLPVVTSVSLFLIVQLSHLFDPFFVRGVHTVFLRFVAVRSFLPRFGRRRNWFIAGQSMNNSSQPIRSPINLGRKAKWVVWGRWNGQKGSQARGGKTKSGISEAVEFNVYDERE